MDILQKMVSTQAALFLYMAVGVICRLAGIINEKSRKHFNAFLVNITLPAMICASFFSKVTSDELAQAGMMLVISACVCLASYGLSLIIWRNKPAKQKSILQFATMFSNAGNAGLPVISMVFGDVGVLYASFYLIPIRVFMWTLGLSFFMPEKGGGKFKKLMTNPCFIAVFVGLGLMLLPFDMPAVLQTSVRGIGNMTGPLSMMIIGSTLSEMRPKDMLDVSALGVSALRLIVIPLLLMALMRLANVPQLSWQIATTLVAMPVATLTVVFAETYGGDHHFASRSVFISTVLSLITVPLITLLF